MQDSAAPNRVHRDSDHDNARFAGAEAVTSVSIALGVQFLLILALVVINRVSAPAPEPVDTRSLVVRDLLPAQTVPSSTNETPEPTVGPAPLEAPLPIAPPFEPPLEMPDPAVFDLAHLSVAVLPSVLLATRSAPVREEVAPVGVVVEPVEAAEVDTPPIWIETNARGTYPFLALRRRWTGTVWVRVLVAADGRVERVAGIVRTEGRDVFRDAVLEVAPTWRFEPAVWRGRKVPVWLLQPIRFEWNHDSTRASPR
jgi:TonB family protein